MKKKKASQSGKKSSQLAKSWQKHDGNSDIQGSWTGTPDDHHDMPIQDADDL